MAIYCRMEHIILNKMNDERSRVGVQPLIFNKELTQRAREWSCQMSEENIFTHEGWQERIKSTQHTPGAENIVMVHRSGSDYAADRMYDLLYESKSHRMNMEFPAFQQVGVGVCKGLSGIYATQLFTFDIAAGIIPIQSY